MFVKHSYMIIKHTINIKFKNKKTNYNYKILTLVFDLNEIMVDIIITYNLG